MKRAGKQRVDKQRVGKQHARKQPAARAMRRAAPPAGPLRLPAALEIHCVRDLASLALERLAAGRAVRIDGSAVQSADTAGLQLLVALRRDALANGTSFEWHGTSPVLLATGAILGLSASLGFVEAT